MPPAASTRRTSPRPARSPRARRAPVAAAEHKNHAIYFVPGLRRGLLVLETLANEGRVWEIGASASLFATPATAEFRQFLASSLK